MLSSDTMHQVGRFKLIANTFRSNGFERLRSDFLDYSKFYIYEKQVYKLELS